MLQLLLLLSTLSYTLAETPVDPHLDPPSRVNLQPPEEARYVTSRNVWQSWLPMPIDHFDSQNNDTFLMRFMFNEEFFGGSGYPIFIMVGGEWAITAGWLQTGNMYMMAQENHGFLIYTEHRYYGQTLPFQQFTTENLRFLNVDQALADLAYFIMTLKKEERFAQSKVVLYGGSYAANMALWFKQRYPHLVEGVVASSGPIMGKVNFTGYLEVVHEAYLSEGGEECISVIRQGLVDTAAAVQTPEGRRLVEETYRLCTSEGNEHDFDNHFDMGYFTAMITWTFSSSVQVSAPGSILNICNNYFNNNDLITSPMQKVANYVNTAQGLAPQSCWLLRYDNFVASYQNTNPSVNRAWYYQTCTEMGYFQTTPSSGTVFDPMIWLDEDFYIEVCKRAFDERYDKEFVYDAVDRVNLIFGGLKPNVNNTINIHGQIDPWRALGVYAEDIKESSPTYTVPRASHCFDLYNWRTTDTIRMTQVQQAARRIVASWL